MNSSGKSTGNADQPNQDHPFVAEGGVPYSPTSNRDPFQALDELMCVVEALAPTWPPRAPMKEGMRWLL